jgi:hypothetical protein
MLDALSSLTPVVSKNRILKNDICGMFLLNLGKIEVKRVTYRLMLFAKIEYVISV